MTRDPKRRRRERNRDPHQSRRSGGASSSASGPRVGSTDHHANGAGGGDIDVAVDELGVCRHMATMWNDAARASYWRTLALTPRGGSGGTAVESKMRCLSCGRDDCIEHAVACDVAAGEVWCRECDRYVFSSDSDRVRCHALYERRRRGEGASEVRPLTTGVFSLRGLVNLGNTCFMNSVLQVVTNIAGVKDHFLSGRHNRTCAVQRAIRTAAVAQPSRSGSPTPIVVATTLAPASVTHTAVTPSSFSGEPPPSSIVVSVPNAARYLALWDRPWALRVPPSERLAASDNYRTTLPLATTSGVCFGCEIEALIAEQNCPGDSSSHTPLTSTQHILLGLWESSPALAGYLQQDSQEFFGALVNALHAHTCTESDVDLGHTPRASANANAAASPSQANKDGRLACACVVHANLAGVLRSQIECVDCSNRTSVFEAFFDVPLDLSVASETRTTLMACLDAFVTAERLPATSDPCVSCCAQTERLKTYSVHALPQILTFHLKRFQSGDASRGGARELRKSDAIVDFPLRGLDMRAYVSMSLCACRRARGHVLAANDVEASADAACDCFAYDLLAVVQHTGELGGGHYISFVRCAADAWFRFDDSLLSRVSEDTVLRGQAYMLFYQRRASPSAPASS